MNLQRYVRLLESAFVLNLLLMGAVLVDFLILGQRLVTFLVGLYAFFVVVLLATWVHHEVRLRRERRDDAVGQVVRPLRALALPHESAAGPINR